MRPATIIAIACALGTACGSAPPAQRSRADSKVMLEQGPATLEAGKKFEGEVKTARVRVYVDADVRGRDTRWKQAFEDQLDYANQFLGPLLGVQLEPEIKTWDYQAPAASLDQTLAALRTLDAGDDVAWVIGVTSPLSLASNNTDALGMADGFGGHVVVRAFAEPAERKALRAALPDLGKTALDEALDARRRHKQTVVLVHELAHSLGAIHESDPNWLMHPTYSHKMTSISDRNRELLAIAITDRMKPKAGRDLPGTAGRVLAAIEASEWGGWIQADRDQVTLQLREVVAAAQGQATASDVPLAARDQFRRAQGMAARNQLAEAAAELDPLLAAYPANATLRLLACQIELRKAGGMAPPAKKVCDRASELAPGDPRPHMTIAAALMQAKDVAAARAQLAEAEKKIANLPRPDDAWIELAQMYQAMGAITWAETAIGKTAATDHPIGAWARTTRARYGVPKGAVKPEDEAAAVTAVRQILDQVYASKFPEADRAAKIAAKRFPRLPGLDAARCDLALRKGDTGGARRRCDAAIDAYPDASWAHYLMGIIILRGSDTKAGIDHLRKAITVDPELAQAWRALAKALQRARDQAGLEKLRADYQAKFGQPLGD